MYRVCGGWRADVGVTWASRVVDVVDGVGAEGARYRAYAHEEPYEEESATVAHTCIL